MSINDLLDVEIFTPELFGLLFAVILIGIPVGLIMGSKAKKDIYGDSSSTAPMEQCVATLVFKHSTPHPVIQTLIVNTAVFETDDKQRIELAISDFYDFNTMIEGDRGILYYQDNRFIDFERE